MERITDRSALPNPRLEVRDLRVVLALAAAGTTTDASKLLHLTQPAVSRALLAIEEKLGVQLFERGPRGMLLTEVGARLVEGAHPLLGELHELERRIGSAHAPPARLRLVCECYTAYHWLPSVLTRLRTELPSLEIELAIEHTQDPIAALEDGRIDVALLTTAMRPTAGLQVQPLFADEVVFVVSSSSPLARHKSLAAETLEQHTLFASNVPSNEARWFRNAVFGRRRVRLEFELIPLTEAILDCARAGMGIAVLSEWIAQPHLGRGDLVARRLRSGPLHRPWYIAYRSDVADSARRLTISLQATAPSRSTAR